MAKPPYRVWLVAGLLVLVTIAVYWPATGYDFVNYDDPLYITDNPHIRVGLTWDGLAWAFGRMHGEGTYWHPLTWVSHMADCQMYGLKPWGHHLTSVLLHAANAVLVFLVFFRMTGAFGRCAVLAALFALHPLQVDSVAWVTERKNLLSAFFWLLTTWAYVRYAEKLVVSGRWSVISSHPSGVSSADDGPRPTDYRSLITDHGSLFYLLSLCFFALGLMCKPVLVTLPFVLLLLDYWPLRRFQLSPLNSAPRQSEATAGQLSTIRRLLLEKTPFLVLAAASSLITILAHDALGMLGSATRLPLDTRIANALVSYVRYLGKTFWPSRLAVFYPYPAAWPGWEVVSCGLLLLVVSALVLSTARSRPWLWVGWFYFLGVLVPFSGLIQAGAQAMADRFMYVPMIGIFVAIIWGLQGLAQDGRYQRLGLAVAGGVALVLCLALTRRQLGHWKDGETLFRHALEVTEKNNVAHNGLGVALAEKGHNDEAILQYQEAIRLKPDDDLAHYNLGNALHRKGQNDEAIRQYQEAIRLKPDDANAHNNLGAALILKGDFGGAKFHLQESVRLRPDDTRGINLLGILLAEHGDVKEAVLYLQAACRPRRELADIYCKLALELDGRGKSDRAILCYRECLRLKPDRIEAANNLAWILATSPDPRFRDGNEAVRLAEHACELSGGNQPLPVGTLAAAYAEAGDFQAAIASAERAAALASSLHLDDVAARNRELIQLYRQGQPFHEKRETTTDGHR